MNLQGIGLQDNNLSGWDFSGQDLTHANLRFSTLAGANLSGANLTGAVLFSSTLRGANLSGAVVTGADFYNTTSNGFSEAHLASTASYQSKNLQGIRLETNDLTGWDLSGQNLTNASLSGSTLANADLSGAVVTGANFASATAFGFTEAQLASTASYQSKNLQGIRLVGNDLTGWDLTGQDLTNADLRGSTLANADLSGANLRNANLGAGTIVASVGFASSTIYNQWTVFPEGFDPVTFGLTLLPSPKGDFDANDALDADDVDMLAYRIGRRNIQTSLLSDSAFDVNSDGNIDLEDYRVWVKDLKHTWFGDANLDGEFDSDDLIQVLSARKYETTESVFFGDIHNPVIWSEGDWNADHEFTTADLVVALADGGYERGPRAAVASVPEPATLATLLVGVIAVLSASRTRREDPLML
jgi:uncharacterized protein YjbI with pentapeptide repeats